MHLNSWGQLSLDCDVAGVCCTAHVPVLRRCTSKLVRVWRVSGLDRTFFNRLPGRGANSLVTNHGSQIKAQVLLKRCSSRCGTLVGVVLHVQVSNLHRTLLASNFDEERPLGCLHTLTLTAQLF